MEHFDQSLTILLFLSTFSTSLRCYAKRNWKSRVCAWSKLWNYWFVKKQRYKVPNNFRRLLWTQRPLLTWPSLGDIRVWAQSTLNTNIFTRAQSKLGRDVEVQNTHIVFFKSPRDVMQVTTLSTQLGLGSELFEWYRDATSVPFGHLFDWFFDTHRRSVTLLYKHRIHSLKILYPGPAETIKNFGRWTHNISLLSKCSNHFPTNAKVFSFSLAQKSFSRFFANAK